MQKSLIALTATMCVTSTQAFEVLDLPKFVAGLLNGFIKVENLTELETCMTNADGLVSEVENAFEDFEANTYEGYLEGMAEVTQIMQDAPKALVNCQNLPIDEE